MTGAARTVAVTGAGVAAVLVGWLHVLRPDLPPASHRLSEYATGPYGWVMTLTFVALGIGVAAFGLALPRRAGRMAAVAAVAAVVGGLGLIVSGVYPSGVSTDIERWHSLASTLATLATTGLALAWSAVTRRRLHQGLAGMAAALTAASPALHDTAVTGLGQRGLWVLLAVWLVLAALALPRGTVAVGNDVVWSQVERSDTAANGPRAHH
jgi:hypothetical membrane protein